LHLLSGGLAAGTFTTEGLTVTLTVKHTWPEEKHPDSYRCGINDLIEHAKVAAELGGDGPDRGYVFADEVACRLDERRNGMSCRDDVQHATVRAAMPKRGEQR
jgi:hypothetical protein